MRELNSNHWVYEDYKERMTTKEWGEILLEHRDRIIFRGHSRRIVGKRIEPGVYEVFKELLNAVSNV